MVLANYSLLLPDAWLILMALIAEVLVICRLRRAIYPSLVFATLVAAVLYAITAYSGKQGHFFYDAYTVDALTSTFKSILSLAFALTLIYSHDYRRNHHLDNSEFYMLALFSLFGQILMVSGGDFLVLYLGLEMMSLPLYALIALQRFDNRATEAALKYYVLGALASGILLYGISIIYGATGSISISDVFVQINNAHINHNLLVFGLVFIVAGAIFKLGAVPFHMWVPDVYEGSPTAITLLIGAGSKLAALAFVMRFLTDSFLSLAVDWQQMLVVAAALSLIVGNVMGIIQKNIKRMLAYSAIGHQGFVLLGLASGFFENSIYSNAITAYTSAYFYSIVYLITTLGAFAIIMLLSRANTDLDQINDLKGLNRRHPWIAFLMLILMFSMAGIPPTLGFYAKLLVLSSVVNANMTWLAVLAVIASVIGAYYYLRIVKVMYFDEAKAEIEHVTKIEVMMAEPKTNSSTFLISVNCLALLILGLWPTPLINLSSWAILTAYSL